MVDKIGIFWFRQDLRLNDNRSLNELIKNCDKIIYFEKGKIVASGSFDELLKNSDFKKLSEVS